MKFGIGEGEHRVFCARIADGCRIDGLALPGVWIVSGDPTESGIEACDMVAVLIQAHGVGMAQGRFHDSVKAYGHCQAGSALVA